MFLVGKVVTGIYWIAVILGLFQVFSENVVSVLNISALIILAVHLLEAIFFRRRFGHLLVEPKFDLAMVMIFGVFHMMPIINKHLDRHQSR